MKQIYFVRHGETEYNKLKIVQGSGVDAALNDKGKQQALAFFQYYEHTPFEVVYTSKLIRTHQTVKHFIDKGIRWEQWEALNEISWGVHEGKKGTPAMKESYKALIEAWSNGNFDAALERGESARELAERLNRFLNHIKTTPEKKILVCTHGRSMRCIMSLLKNEHLREMEKYMHHNTGLYVATFEHNDFEVIIENDTKHLPTL